MTPHAAARTDLAPQVIAAADGDVDAFSEIVDATGGLVSAIALAILHDLDASRDVAQDVFLVAWRDLKTLRQPDRLLPWLQQIARNRAHETLRSRVRARRRHADEGAEAIEVAADPRPAADAVLIASEDARRLRDAIVALSDDARETVLLYYYEGQSIREVAALLDISEDAVKKRLSRARESLRASLLDDLGATIAGHAPGRVLTIAVISAIAVNGPPAAAATATALKIGASQQASAGAAAKLGLIAGVPVLGALAGAGFFLTGMRSLAKQADDDVERRAVARAGWVSAAIFVAIWAPLPLWWRLPRPWGFVLPVICHAVSMLLLHGVWLPRLLARRFARELADDPAGATARRSRERRVWWVGFAVGLLGAVAGQLIGFIATR